MANKKTGDIEIGGRLFNTATGNIVAGADAIKDEAQGKTQAEINVETYENVAEINAALQELSPDQTEALALATDVVNLKEDVDQGAVFDVSAKYPTSGVEGGNTYTLEGALAVLNANLPASKKRGGMIFKFVQSSDNKYVQFRCKTQSFSVDPEDWYFEVNGTLVENPEYIAVYTDADGKIILAVENDGNIHFGAGVPKQVINYITAKIAELSLDEYEDIVVFLGNLINGDKTLAELLNEKVDKEEGKSLIDAEYANGVNYIENPEFAEVRLDSENKIIWAVKTDGSIYYGAGCPPQVKEYIEEKIEELSLDKVEDIVTFLGDLLEGDKTLQDLLDEKVDKEEGKSLIDKDVADREYYVEKSDYMSVEVDGGNKILGGRKADGTKFENTPIETPTARVEYIEHLGWIDIKTDNNGRLLEGINVNGEKHISQFDVETNELIKDIVSGPHETINIPLLDENFESPVKVTITGTKGDKDAKYEFELPLKDCFNIRFKFRIADNLMNQNSSVLVSNDYVICQIDNAIVSARTFRLSQYTEEIEYSGETKTMYFPTLKGGMLYRHNNYANYFDAPFAFYVKYIGESNTASIQNNGTELILKSGTDTFTYTLSSYDSVYALYAALKTNSLFDVEYKELEGHTCDELAIFPECTLISNYYTETNTEQSPRVEYEDSCAPFFVPYAKDDKWHQVEIIKTGDYIYTSVDGQYYDRDTYTGGKVLQLGGNCGVYFKDLEIGLNTVLDAEIVDNVIVSSASPCLIVFEGHGMLDKPIDEFSGSQYSEEGMATSTDRLYYVFREMIKKGYVPVTIDDINAYYNRERYIPKRSFTIVFDDFRYENCLDLAFRKVFIELGVKPALAIIYNASREIVFDGNVITKKEASEICLRNNFQLLNHTNHGNAKDINPSLLMSKYENDVIQADKILVDGMTIVYPFGATNLYIYNTLKWLGCKLGINVGGGSHHNPLYSNRYNIRRVEIGSRDTLENIINNIY